MHIIFLNGSEFKGSWSEFTRALRHPWFIGLILSMVVLIFWMNPYDNILPEGIILRLLIIASSVALFLTVAIFCVSRCAKANIPAHSLAMMTPAIILTSMWGVGFSVLTGGSLPSFWGWVQLFGFDFVYCMTGELVLSSFLLRRIALETGLGTYPVIAVSPNLADQPAPIPETPEDSGPIKLEILGQPVELAELWHLKAEEHYVLLRLRDGASQLQRGRLADAIAQLPTKAGLQVHRSHWVSISAVDSLERRRNGWLLHLRNGSSVPVARNRQAEVRDWVETTVQTAGQTA